MGTEMLAAVERAGADVAGDKEYIAARNAQEAGARTLQPAVELITFLASAPLDGLTGKLISAAWDNWDEFPSHLNALGASDVFTLRRVAGRERGLSRLDK